MSFSIYSPSTPSLDYAIDLKEDELNQVKLDIVDLNTQIGVSEDCENNTTCDSCTINNSCVWCSSSKKCVDGSVKGAYDDSEDCSDYEYEVCKDPDCDAYTSCNQCLSNSLCAWCRDSDGCIDLEGKCEVFTMLIANTTCALKEASVIVGFKSLC